MNPKAIKIPAIVAATLLAASTLSYACDNAIGETVYTMAPGQTQTVQWDFSNCWFGIQSWTISLGQPRTKNGGAQALSPNTPLKVSVINVTKGEVYVGTSSVISFLNENCCGDVIVMTMTYSASAKKPLSVLVTTTGNLGGM